MKDSPPGVLFNESVKGWVGVCVGNRDLRLYGFGGLDRVVSRVGEIRADELRREHFGLLREVIAAHGGREVKNLGDGLMVVFDGVTAALDGAVAMQQAIAGRRSDEPMTIRVGVASGDCDVDDGDYFGLPVVEAARLSAKAQSGEILATELVRMLAGRAAPLRWSRSVLSS